MAGPAIEARLKKVQGLDGRPGHPCLALDGRAGHRGQRSRARVTGLVLQSKTKAIEAEAREQSNKAKEVRAHAKLAKVGFLS
jgi:hypothetical protein